MFDERELAPEFMEEDHREPSLRPQRLEEYIGQSRVKDNLKIFIEAAQGRSEALDHCLFSGPPGLGKTTLAHIIAEEMGVSIKTTSGPVIERGGDLAAILTNLQAGDVFFIDEIHRLNRQIEELLYPAMEDYELDIIIGSGPSARTIKMPLPRFTLIGATTREGMLTPPLRARFGIHQVLDFYNPAELQVIIEHSAGRLDVQIDEAGALEIAKRSRGTPRIANRLLRRVRDYAEVKADGFINQAISDAALTMLGVDEMGFDRMDRRILLTIIDKFGGGPVGLDTLAAAIGEERDTIEDVYEPYLLQNGFLNRTRSGRVASLLAYRHFERVPPAAEERQGRLF